MLIRIPMFLFAAAAEAVWTVSSKEQETSDVGNTDREQGNFVLEYIFQIGYFIINPSPAFH